MTTKSPQDECRQDRRGDPGAPAHPGGGHAPDADYTLLVAMPGTSQARPGDPLVPGQERRASPDDPEPGVGRHTRGDGEGTRIKVMEKSKPTGIAYWRNERTLGGQFQDLSECLIQKSCILYSPLGVFSRPAAPVCPESCGNEKVIFERVASVFFYMFWSCEKSIVCVCVRQMYSIPADNIPCFYIINSSQATI